MCTKAKRKQKNIFECMIYITCVALVVFFLSFLSSEYISYILKTMSIIIFIYLSGLLLIYINFKKSIFLERAILYFGIIPIIFFISVIISHLIVFNSGSSISVISAIIQSDAAILAIYVTLSLVAVQQASSSYSPRVMRIFNDREKNPDFWILVTIYILSIIYGSFVLSQVGNSNIYNFGNNYLIIELFSLQNHIVFTFFLGTYTFVALLPNIRSTITFLDPFHIINFLSCEISKEGVLDYIQNNDEGTENNEAKSPLLPIIDIVRASLINFDNETSILGIKVIGDNILRIIENEKITDDDSLMISKYAIENMLTVLQLALEKNNEKSVSEVIKFIGKFSVVSQKKSRQKTRIYLMRQLYKMESRIIKYRMCQPTLNLAQAFLEISKCCCENEEPVIDECAYKMRFLIELSVECKLFRVIEKIHNSLESSILKEKVGLEFERLNNGYRICGKTYPCSDY